MLSGLHMWASAALTLSSCVTESCPTLRLVVQGDDRLKGLRWKAVEELVLQEQGQTNQRATSLPLVFSKQGRVTRLHTLLGLQGQSIMGNFQPWGQLGSSGPCHPSHLEAALRNPAGPDMSSGGRTKVVGLLGCMVRIAPLHPHWTM